MEYSLSAFDYDLPEELIAQEPPVVRDQSRLLVLDRVSGNLTHAGFGEVPTWLGSGDVLVVNDTRVFPARLRGRKESGGRVELLLTDWPGPGDNGATPREAVSRALWRASRQLRVGQMLHFGPALRGEVVALGEPGEVEVRLTSPGDIRQALHEAGELPLPPYIRRPCRETDRERYQTVFAERIGAVAAPTAGLHFTAELLARVRQGGVEVAHLTLHVGPGTFQPVRTTDYRQHRLGAEFLHLSEESAEVINRAKAGGKRIVAVGTTTVRGLEYLARGDRVVPGEGWCDLFICPGYSFQVVDRLITNFHLPRSTLLLLVSAFAGRERILAAYREAVRERYRFYSYGDAMLIL